MHVVIHSEYTSRLYVGSLVLDPDLLGDLMSLQTESLYLVIHSLCDLANIVHCGVVAINTIGMNAPHRRLAVSQTFEAQ
jgi:hypothetical protein